jgi:hypothetical protein
MPRQHRSTPRQQPFRLHCCHPDNAAARPLLPSSPSPPSLLPLLLTTPQHFCHRSPAPAAARATRRQQPRHKNARERPREPGNVSRAMQVEQSEASQAMQAEQSVSVSGGPGTTANAPPPPTPLRRQRPNDAPLPLPHRCATTATPKMRHHQRPDIAVAATPSPPPSNATAAKALSFFGCAGGTGGGANYLAKRGPRTYFSSKNVINTTLHVRRAKRFYAVFNKNYFDWW